MVKHYIGKEKCVQQVQTHNPILALSRNTGFQINSKSPV